MLSCLIDSHFEIDDAVAQRGFLLHYRSVLQLHLFSELLKVCNDFLEQGLFLITESLQEFIALQ